MSDIFIRRRAILALADILSIVGVNNEAAFSASGIDRQQLAANPQFPVSLQQFAEFFIQSRRLSNTDAHGFDPSVHVPFGVHRLGLLQLDRDAPLRELFQFDKESMRLLGIEQWPFFSQHRDNSLCWCFIRSGREQRIPNSLLAMNDSIYLYWWLLVMSWLVDEALKPQKIYLMHDRNLEPSEWQSFSEQLFGCEVEYQAAYYGIELPDYVGNYHLKRSRTELRRQCDRAAESLSAPISNPLSSWSDRVTKILTEGGNPGLSINEVANTFHVSASSLKRYLALEGTRFQKLKDECRLEMAKAVLQRPEIPVNDIAYDIGFASPSAFYRAFKHWTGMTPVSYRACHLPTTGFDTRTDQIR